MELNLDTIKQLSPQRKAIVVIILFALLGYLYYTFVLQSSVEKRSKLTERNTTLDQQITEKNRLAKQKDRYLREVSQLQENLKMVLTKLPNEREIPELFQSIAVSGKNAGIDFILFEPQQVIRPKTVEKKDEKKSSKKDKGKSSKAPEADKNFYEEIPLKISVQGGFHNTVVFFEKVAKLPRIINVQNIDMTGAKDRKSKGKDQGITTSCLMKTYMFVEKKNEKKI